MVGSSVGCWALMMVVMKVYTSVGKKVVMMVSPMAAM